MGLGVKVASPKGRGLTLLRAVVRCVYKNSRRREKAKKLKIRTNTSRIPFLHAERPVGARAFQKNGTKSVSPASPHPTKPTVLPAYKRRMGEPLSKLSELKACSRATEEDRPSVPFPVASRRPPIRVATLTSSIYFSSRMRTVPAIKEILRNNGRAGPSENCRLSV